MTKDEYMYIITRTICSITGCDECKSIFGTNDCPQPNVDYAKLKKVAINLHNLVMQEYHPDDNNPFLISLTDEDIANIFRRELYEKD